MNFEPSIFNSIKILKTHESPNSQCVCLNKCHRGAVCWPDACEAKESVAPKQLRQQGLKDRTAGCDTARFRTCRRNRRRTVLYGLCYQGSDKDELYRKTGSACTPAASGALAVPGAGACRHHGRARRRRCRTRAALAPLRTAPSAPPASLPAVPPPANARIV